MTEGTSDAQRRADRPRRRGARRVAVERRRLGRLRSSASPCAPASSTRALAIIADVARNATLADEEIDRQRTTAIDAVAVAMRDPGEVAGLAAMRALYGTGAYGHPAGGTAASLRAHHPRRRRARLSQTVAARTMRP